MPQDGESTPTVKTSFSKSSWKFSKGVESNDLGRLRALETAVSAGSALTVPRCPSIVERPVHPSNSGRFGVKPRGSDCGPSSERIGASWAPFASTARSETAPVEG